jgi:cyclophilin family peptidyl-prolyl cis-trans isomerase
MTSRMEHNSLPPQTIDPAKSYTATVQTARGVFTLRLDPAAAPVTVNNFVHLAQQEFYSGLTFHRVEPGFVLQGGDPLGNGTGGLGYRLPDETNPAPWLAGSLGMASNAAGVSACQFFILLGDAPHLARSGVYNHFGRVIAGMDVVGAIRPGDRIEKVEVSAA